MNHAAAPRSLVNPATRLATALAVTAAVALAWTGALSASHDAVDGAAAQFASARTHAPAAVASAKTGAAVTL
jgi:hypothetical protein